MNKCGKGEQCAFAHSLSEIREKPDLVKTSMCRTFLQTGNCADPRCSYAHSEQELRTTEGFFKTKLCRFAPSGRCKHGSACRFAHSTDEVSLGPALSLRDHDLQVAAPTSEWTDSPSEQSMRDISSDQSTRAETVASVPTPEGSGDSGQEESTGNEPTFRRAAPGEERATRPERRGSERQNGRQCTTVMVTNIPNFLTQGSLVSLLEDLTPCMRGAFDFFFCPWDPYEDCNLGYVIINFFTRGAAVEFERHWANQPLLPRTQWTKRLRMLPAALQGRAANLRHFSGFTLAHHPDPRFRPLVRPSPQAPLRPMAVPQELGQTQRQDAEQEIQMQTNSAVQSQMQPESPQTTHNQLLTMLAQAADRTKQQMAHAAQAAQATQPAHSKQPMQGNWGSNGVAGASVPMMMQPTCLDVPWPQRENKESVGVPGLPIFANDHDMQQYWAMLLPQGMTAAEPACTPNGVSLAAPSLNVLGNMCAAPANLGTTQMIPGMHQLHQFNAAALGQLPPDDVEYTD